MISEEWSNAKTFSLVTAQFVLYYNVLWTSVSKEEKDLYRALIERLKWRASHDEAQIMDLYADFCDKFCMKFPHMPPMIGEIAA